MSVSTSDVILKNLFIFQKKIQKWTITRTLKETLKEGIWTDYEDEEETEMDEEGEQQQKMRK